MTAPAPASAPRMRSSASGVQSERGGETMHRSLESKRPRFVRMLLPCSARHLDLGASTAVGASIAVGASVAVGASIVFGASVASRTSASNERRLRLRERNRSALSARRVSPAPGASPKYSRASRSTSGLLSMPTIWAGGGR